MLLLALTHMVHLLWYTYYLYLLSILTVFNCRIIGVYKLSLNKLYSQ